MPSHPDVCRAGDRTGRLGEVDAVETHASAVETQRCGRLLERFPVSNAIVEGHGAEPYRRFVVAGEVELTAQSTRDRPVVEFERMAQAVEIAVAHANARVDLFAAVLPRITERVEALSANFRVALANQPVGHRHVAVLDHDLRGAVTPERVPRSQVFAAEDPFHPRPPERAGHAAVELAAAAKRDNAGPGAKVGQQAGQDLVALLPVGARHVKPEG